MFIFFVLLSMGFQWYLLPNCVDLFDLKFVLSFNWLHNQTSILSLNLYLLSLLILALHKNNDSIICSLPLAFFCLYSENE
jgi:hypothetical protein